MIEADRSDQPPCRYIYIFLYSEELIDVDTYTGIKQHLQSSLSTKIVRHATERFWLS